MEDVVDHVELCRKIKFIFNQDSCVEWRVKGKSPDSPCQVKKNEKNEHNVAAFGAKVAGGNGHEPAEHMREVFVIGKMDTFPSWKDVAENAKKEKKRTENFECLFGLHIVCIP